MGINRVTLHGNVVADPEIGVKGKGKNKIKYAHFSFAVNSSKKNADFFNCTAFNDVADFLENYVTKGQELIIQGSIKNNHYEDKDGVMHYADQIVVYSIDFCGKKVDEDGEGDEDDFIENGLPFN